MRNERTGDPRVDRVIDALRDEIRLLRRDLDQRVSRYDRDTNRLVVGTPDGKASVQVDVDDGEKSTPLRRDIDGRGMAIRNVKLVEADEVKSLKGTVRIGRDISMYGDGERSRVMSPWFDGDVVLAPMWDDQQVDVSAVKVGANAPDYDAFVSGVYLYKFIGDGVKVKEVFFTVQLPHKMKENSVIDPHVHWAPNTTGAGNVVWGLEYTWQNINTAYTSTSTVYTAASAAPGVAKQHTIAEFAGITPAAGQGGISSILVCRLFRNPAKADDPADTYAEYAWLLGFDIHVECDSLGSRQEYVK